MVKLADYNTAIRIKRVMRGVARQVVSEMRPLPRVATVVGINRLANSADIMFLEDTEPSTVYMSNNLQPVQVGDKVRVAGQGRGKFIMQIVGQSTGYQWEPGLKDPLIYGGLSGGFVARGHISYDGITTVPGVGNCFHIGRWEVESGNMISGLLVLDLTVRKLNPHLKHYEIPLRDNATGGTWMKIHPEFDSGPYMSAAYQLEMLVDTTGFELRIRRTVGGTNPAGFLPPVISGYVTGNTYSYDDASAQGESAGALPTRSYGLSIAGTGASDVFQSVTQVGSSERNFGWRAQSLLSGGGVKLWDGTNFTWSARFIVIGFGSNWLFPGAFLNLPVMTAGVQVPIVNNPTTTFATSIANGVPLGNWHTLYYEPPFGAGTAPASGDAGNVANYRIVDWGGDANTDFIVPAHWIMVAQRNVDEGRIYCGDGQIVDTWRVLSGSYATNMSYPAVSVREISVYKDAANVVHLEGTINCAVAFTTLTSIGKTIPVGYRPSNNINLTGARNTTADTWCKMQIQSDGTVLIYTAASGNLHFAAISWVAAL
jgi:hypothetical protein